ncbi:8342_t:CDS:10 [Ambispora gerdemannii]|uniref:Exocyst complex component Sec8 n=1 Tax=Ambispora gerdemannii TaxID=144530 RepID=A0A9N8YPY3_9GLOM|nr:8342_t:CDS:10 [Ambispora gerdemannii]
MAKRGVNEDWGRIYPNDFRNGKKDSLREMEAAMQQINQQWEFMMSDDLALSLLDASSLGRGHDIAEFSRTMDSLNRALQYIVNGKQLLYIFHFDWMIPNTLNYHIFSDYYQGFNSSIGTFGGVMQNIGDSQDRVREIKSQLKECKQALLSKRADLLQLWFRSQQYKEMLRILDSIEDIQGTHQKLEGLLREKHFLTASKILLDAIRIMDRKEMMGIGALHDLRRYLKAQQTSLHEVLIEELHNHLYLKSPYCASRWFRYTKDQNSLPTPATDWSSEKESRKNSTGLSAKNKKNLSVNILATAAAPHSPKSPMPSPSPKPLNISPKLQPHVIFIDDDEMITEDLDRNPESDSFYYIEIIIESLALLGLLPEAMEMITQRLPLELYQLVDKTVAEVEERRTVHVFASRNTKKNDLMNIYLLESPENEVQMEILRDLMWTLYSKLDAVLQGHRFILDVVERISKRPMYAKITDGKTCARPQEDFIKFTNKYIDFLEKKKIKAYPFIDIWKPVQSELRTLLRDYITDDERDSASFTTPVATINDMMRDRRGRDRTKQIFKFSDIDATSNIELDDQYESDINSMLQKSLPNLFAKLPDEKPPTSVLVVDKFANTNISVGHRLVVRPDAFNVSVLFKPTLIFLDKVREIVPSTTTVDFSGFLDDFVFNVFLPQIEDKEDPNHKRFTTLPLIKSATTLMKLVESLCAMLRTMTFHKEEYSRMIISVLTQYYVKCFEQYQAVVSKGSLSDEGAHERTGNAQKTSAMWVQQDQLSEIFTQYPYLDENDTENRKKRKLLCEKETQAELKLKKNRVIRSGELIFDGRKLKGLGHLYHSLKWFVGKIWQLRGRDSKVAGLMNGKMDDGLLAKVNRRWSSYEDIPKSNRLDDEARLPLTGEMANRFDALLATFQQLAEQCLFTLRVELRCHTLHYIDMAMREGNYQLQEEASEPDPFVLMLNSDLVHFDECITSSLPIREHKFVFEGLDSLMEHILVSNATYIKSLNFSGVTKIKRNILALQQNLRNIVDTPNQVSLDRSQQYYELHRVGAANMLNLIREKGAVFSFEEYKTMLEIIYGIESGQQKHSSAARHESPSQSRRMFNEHLIELNELMLDFL